MSEPLPSLDARLRTVLPEAAVGELDASREFEGQRGLDLLNLILARTNIDEFRIHRWQDGRLVLVGSFDHCYYHEVAVHFVDVVATQLPEYLSAHRFRVATADERTAFFQWVGLPEPDSALITIDGDAGGEDRSFFVAAMRIEVDPGLVFYYDREAQQPLKAGERVDPRS